MITESFDFEDCFDWASLVRQGIEDGKIAAQGENDVPFYDILTYAKEMVNWNGNPFQLGKQRMAILDGYRMGVRWYLSDRNKEKLNCNRQMNKKLIRLTEGDLHKIVKESVSKVLTELDWKTYANAQKKASRIGDKERAYKFGRSAIDNFNKEYGYHKSKYDYDDNGFPSYGGEYRDYKMTDMNGDSISSSADQGWSGKYDWGTDFNGEYSFSPDAINSNETIDPYGLEIDPWLNTAKNVGNREIKDYTTGKYNYLGHGWRKK